jgi:hypothetical protein
VRPRPVTQVLAAGGVSCRRASPRRHIDASLCRSVARVRKPSHVGSQHTPATRHRPCRPRLAGVQPVGATEPVVTVVDACQRRSRVICHGRRPPDCRTVDPCKTSPGVSCVRRHLRRAPRSVRPQHAAGREGPRRGAYASTAPDDPWHPSRMSSKCRSGRTGGCPEFRGTWVAAR